MVLSGKFYHDTSKIHWLPPLPPSPQAKNDDRSQIKDWVLLVELTHQIIKSILRISLSNTEEHSNRSFLKKKDDNWPWFNQESLAILEMKIDLSEKFACVKF